MQEVAKFLLANEPTNENITLTIIASFLDASSFSSRPPTFSRNPRVKQRRENAKLVLPQHFDDGLDVTEKRTKSREATIDTRPDFKRRSGVARRKLVTNRAIRFERDAVTSRR